MSTSEPDQAPSAQESSPSPGPVGRRAGKELPTPSPEGESGADLLFLVRANGALAPVTHQHPAPGTRHPAPMEGDTMILLGPAPAAS
jgi:hypothetical protein